MSARGGHWSQPNRTAGAAALVALLVAGVALLGPAVPAAARAATPTSSVVQGGVLDPGLATSGHALRQVIVTGRQSLDELARAVTQVGGSVGRRLDLVDGIEAQVPADRLVELTRRPGVLAVTADRVGRLSSVSQKEEVSASTFVSTTQASAAWERGGLGQGVGVAVLDSGVSPVRDLQGRLVHGPDLSGEGSVVDSYGHGTVMAGVIAGSGADSASDGGPGYTGAAPRATVVAVKVAGRNGAVDVSTVLQAMHWISAYQEQFNIRVLNLSWGVPSTQDPQVDPLDYAVERLWQQGIAVVVAAGNGGPDPSTITKPADDPLVISVGAYDDRQNLDQRDDVVTAWSSRGPTAQGVAKPDLVAPGRTIVATRSPGSAVTQDNPAALIEPSYIKGSGTSEAAAVTSGAVAALLSLRPSLTPDQVKALLVTNATPILGTSRALQGAGRLQLAKALKADPGPQAWQKPSATGLGSLEASRGPVHVRTTCPDGTTQTVQGETDARCQPFDAKAWAGSPWTGDTWTGVTWNGVTWNGVTWNGVTWNGVTWNGFGYSSAEFGGALQTVMWGSRAPYGRQIPGEESDPAPDGPPRDPCRTRNDPRCR